MANPYEVSNLMVGYTWQDRQINYDFEYTTFTGQEAVGCINWYNPKYYEWSNSPPTHDMLWAYKEALKDMAIKRRKSERYRSKKDERRKKDSEGQG